MGIKLCKKESMEHCDSCGAIMTEYEYDRYGGLCKRCRSEESKQETPAASEGRLRADTFAEPSFDAATYGLEEITKNKDGEIDVVDAIDSNDSAQALADMVMKLRKKHPEKKYHINAIGVDSDGVEDSSETIWSDYPEEVNESTNDLRGFYLKVWYGLVDEYKMSGEAADALCDKYQKEIIDGYENGEGPAQVCDAIASKNKTQEGTDGFSHTWELQAQQAKETLEELTKKFSDADRLTFEIRNFPHRQECDVVVSVDGNPFITAEFEGGRHSGLRWHCFEDDVNDVHLDAGAEDAARNMILAFKDEILDALTSLYGLNESAEKTERTSPDDVDIADGADPIWLVEVEWVDPEEDERLTVVRCDGADMDDAKARAVSYLEKERRAYNARAVSAKQETLEKTTWCVEFGDIYSNVQKEYYDTEEDAKARYDELAARGDIEWVEEPTAEVAPKEEKLSYDDYAESVKTILMGREFEYGPETANEFVVDDYKDIVRQNFDAGKSAFTAASDIDDKYMGKA